MFSRKFYILCAAAFMAAGQLCAQTFSPAGEVKNKTGAETVTAASAKTPSTGSTEGPLSDTVVKNFGASDGEDGKKYDNSMGKVFQFHVENGKIVYDDDRKVLISYENYKVERGMDGIVRCTMRLYIINDLTERISNLGIRLIWPDISTTLQADKVNPGVKTYTDVMLMGEGCLNMDKAPTIEVNRCRVKGMSEEKCADAIRWFRKNQ